MTRRQDETEKYLGTITLKNKIVISDPCYNPGTWCQGVYDNVCPGKYNCYVNYFYDTSWSPNYRRVASIIIVHEKYKSKNITTREDTFTIGIDSGQMGIFDYDYYQNFNGNDDEWYNNVCDLTQEEAPNPSYIPFEKSEFYKESFGHIYDIEDKDKRTSGLLEMWKKNAEYQNHYLISRKTLDAACANLLDEVSIVSSTAWGDVDPVVYVRHNANKEIVAIRLQSR